MKLFNFKNKSNKKKKKVKLKTVSFGPKHILNPNQVTTLHKKSKTIKPLFAFNPPKYKNLSKLKPLNWSQTKRKLPTLSPFGDADKDGVMNFKDCRPFDKKRQDFGKFKPRKRKKSEWTSPEDITAAQRFGPSNIKKLKRIGGGRDRVVYALDKKKVLKVAKNVGGLKQNVSEKDLDYILDHVKHYESGKDYVVMEKIGKLKSQKVKDKLYKMFDEVREEQLNRGTGWGTGDKAKRAIEKIEPQILNYEFSPGDLAKSSSWGEKNGRPILVDAGGLNSETLSDEHRITKIDDRLRRARRQRTETMEHLKEHDNAFDKHNLPRMNRDIERMEMDINEWREIKAQRKQAREREKIKLTDYENKKQEPFETVSKVKWKKKTTIPYVDYPEQYSVKKRRVKMTPDEFMELAKETDSNIEVRNESLEEYKKKVISKTNVERIREGMEKGRHTEELWIAYQEGRPEGHEGRHRATAAEELGEKKVPVHLTVKHEDEPKSWDKYERAEEIAQEVIDESEGVELRGRPKKLEYEDWEESKEKAQELIDEIKEEEAEIKEKEVTEEDKE